MVNIVPVWCTPAVNRKKPCVSVPKRFPASVCAYSPSFFHPKSAYKTHPSGVVSPRCIAYWPSSHKSTTAYTLQTDRQTQADRQPCTVAQSSAFPRCARIYPTIFAAGVGVPPSPANCTVEWSVWRPPRLRPAATCWTLRYGDVATLT